MGSVKLYSIHAGALGDNGALYKFFNKLLTLVRSQLPWHLFDNAARNRTGRYLLPAVHKTAGYFPSRVVQLQENFGIMPVYRVSQLYEALYIPGMSGA